MPMLAEHCQTLTDEEVVGRVLEGETGLYELLLRRYNQRLFRITRAVLRDAAEAEDVIQDAWVRAYEHLAQFAGRARFSTWVSKIAFYEALSRERARRRVSPAGGDAEESVDMEIFESPAPGPEANAIACELRQALESAIDCLPDVYRTVFVLREIEHLSTADTAACLDLSEEAVKTRLHRARIILRRRLSQQLGAVSRESFPFMGERCDRVVAHVMERIARVELRSS